MSSSAKRTIEEHEAARQASGLVPRTIWVPDVSAPGFAEHYRTEMRRLAEAAGERWLGGLVITDGTRLERLEGKRLWAVGATRLLGSLE